MVLLQKIFASKALTASKQSCMTSGACVCVCARVCGPLCVWTFPANCLIDEIIIIIIILIIIIIIIIITF